MAKGTPPIPMYSDSFQTGVVRHIDIKMIGMKEVFIKLTVP